MELLLWRKVAVSWGLVRNYSSKKLAPGRLARLVAEMPKEDSKHLGPLRSARTEKRKNLSNYVPHNVFWHTLGGSAAAPSLLLNTDHAKYLFNCAEGTQRYANEYCGHRTLAQLEHVFITRRSWANLGGLLGMCLSVRSTGAPDITLHGPPGTIKLHEATRSFIVLHDFSVLTGKRAEPKDGNRWYVCHDDAAVRVTQLHLRPRGGRFVPEAPLYSRWAPSGDSFNDSVAVDQTVSAYVVTCKAKAGRLLMDKCLELGVPPGPLLGELKAGRDVRLDSGKLVRSYEVLEEASQPLSYMVVECPSADYLPDLGEVCCSKGSSGGLEDLDHLQAIFHFTPPEVLAQEPYAEWVASFPDRVQNVLLRGMSSASAASSSFGSADILTFVKKLNMINPVLFPANFAGNGPPAKGTAAGVDEPSAPAPLSGRLCVEAKIAMKLHVRPHTNVLESSRIQLDEKGVEAEVASTEGALEAISKARAVIAAKRNELSSALALRTLSSKGSSSSSSALPAVASFPKVTFLGTGSSVPSKYRNVSAILVEDSAGRVLLLDCGEGSLLQMRRLFGGVEGARKVLAKLKAVYVSHLHADHHLGLISILQERDKALADLGIKGDEESKLHLLAPAKIASYLWTYHSQFEPVLTRVHHVRNEHLLPFAPPGGDKGDPDQVNNSSTQRLFPQVLKEVLESMGMSDVRTSRAIHCPASFCLALTFKDKGFKLVYTGDTRPNEDLVELGRGCDLLIHEATMEHHMLEDCKTKKHSTFTEAVQSGKAMGAKQTVLTHFSQRYSKLPILDEFEAEENVAFASDFMTLTPATFDLLRPSYPAFKAVFAEEMEEMVDRREAFHFRNFDSIMKDELGIDLESEASDDTTKKRSGTTTAEAGRNLGHKKKKLKLSDLV